MSTLTSWQGMLRLELFGAALALALASTSAACEGPDGTTPTCEDNATQQGIAKDEDGCNQFARCPGDKTAMSCCEGKVGRDLELCLYGFGARPAPGHGGGDASSASSSATSVGTTSSSTTSSTTGSGGSSASGGGTAGSGGGAAQ